MSWLRHLAADRVAQAALGLHLFALIVLALSTANSAGPTTAILPFIEPLLLAMALVSFLAGRSRLELREDLRFWNLLSMAWLCWLMVEFFFFFEASIPFVSASFAADALYVLFYLFFALAIELKPHLHLRPSLPLFRRRLESTAGLVAVFGLLIYFALVVLPEPLGLSLSFVSRDQGLVPYLLVRLTLDLFLLGRIIYSVFTSTGRWPLIYSFLGAAMLGYALRDTVLLLQYQELIPATSRLFGWSTFLYLPGFLVILAARCRHLALDETGSGILTGTSEPEAPTRISFLGGYMLVIPTIHFVLYPLGLLEESSRAARGMLCLIYLVIIGIISIVHQRATETDRGIAIDSLRLEVRKRARINRELELRQAEMEQFTYTISHELKAPLVTIHGFLGLLEQGIERASTQSIQQDLGRIREAATTMSQLLVELLELSRIGWVLDRKEGVFMSALTESVRSMIVAKPTETEVRITIEEDMPVVHGDTARLRDVLTNLITNAIKFSKGSEPTEIRIGCRKGDQPVFFVSDNGRGIDPHYHDKIFGLFDRLDSNVEGSGVGLALVRRIIEKHGGQVWVESEGEGHGSTFCFTVPPPQAWINRSDDSPA
jgi:signal transduction histidine kinase